MNRIWGEGKTCLGRELVVQSLVLPGIAQGEEQASSCCKKMNEKKMNEKKTNIKIAISSEDRCSLSFEGLEVWCLCSE